MLWKCFDFCVLEMEDMCYVLEEKGNIYSVIFGLVDIVRGINFYYKL